MDLTSLIYISTSAIEPGAAAAEVGRLVETSIANNRSRDLTGALLFTGTYFSQVLEGEADDIDQLLTKLRDDRRHENLAVVDRRSIGVRRFSAWNMAYCGPSLFVSRHVSRLINDTGRAEKNRATAWLSDLMFEFAKA